MSSTNYLFSTAYGIYLTDVAQFTGLWMVIFFARKLERLTYVALAVIAAVAFTIPTSWLFVGVSLAENFKWVVGFACFHVMVFVTAAILLKIEKR